MIINPRINGPPIGIQLDNVIMAYNLIQIPRQHTINNRKGTDISCFNTNPYMIIITTDYSTLDSMHRLFTHTQ